MADNQEGGFEWAVRVGDLTVIRSKIEETPTLANEIGRTGRPPLCVAADYGHFDVIKYLIERGANVNACDSHGITPLLSAIYEGHKECVELLLSNGADKSKKAPNGQSYLECAEDSVIKSLLK
ncbi:DgyrCDS9349 [Dimorphilus gyrociliatus]|uniref:DgyrCDS9349 n=1 Tax=Dimorphilus gyrociliatus TaxID=2664684 RepID=A0A7I8VX28_9ANNE|nr:DgyrCDS9349 [Dimorphilus gyrociliatus]